MNNSKKFSNHLYIFIHIIKNMYEKSFCHSKTLLALEKNQQTLKIEYNYSIYYYSNSSLHFLIFPKDYCNNVLKPILLESLCRKFFQNFLFVRGTHELKAHLFHDSEIFSQFDTEFFETLFLAKKFWYFNIFKKDLFMEFPNKNIPKRFFLTISYLIKKSKFFHRYLNRLKNSNSIFHNSTFLMQNNKNFNLDAAHNFKSAVFFDGRPFFVHPGVSNTDTKAEQKKACHQKIIKFQSKKKKIQNFYMFYFKKICWLVPKNCTLFSISIENTTFSKFFAFLIIQILLKFLYFSSEKRQHFFLYNKKKKLYTLTNFLSKTIISDKDIKNFFYKHNKKKLLKNFLGFKLYNFFIFLCFQYEKNYKKIFFLKIKPTTEATFFHINECKQIIQHGIGQTQLKFMKKLQKKIYLWSSQHNSMFAKKVFYYCDAILFKYLWNWAKKTHPNKSKYWIRKKYFHLNFQKKWFFGKKFGNQFICLYLHSKFLLKNISKNLK